jgi:prephenate dehydratase
VTASRLRVGIQGVRASFHDAAARTWFGERPIEVVECPSFRALADRLAARATDRALMAIENTIAGSILPNYALLEAHGFRIAGEVYLRIEHSFMARPGRRLADLKFARSHPMALAQCEDFLARHPHLTPLEAADTAGSAREIAENGWDDQGAIAHRLAAEVYGLEVLEVGIETDQRNYTRFLVLCRGEDYCAPEVVTGLKASVRFEAAHRPGSLAEVLACLSRAGANLTKIQSVPILGRPYQYSFHVDLEMQDRHACATALAEAQARGLMTQLIHFGEYPKAERPLESLETPVERPVSP